MSFSSPLWLLALLLVPLALLAQQAARRRAQRYALRFPAVPTVLQALGKQPDWRRHIPVAAALAAMAALAVALARPHVTTRVPVREASVMLVLDRSGSMDANDVQPTRLSAAERAANSFIDQLPSSARVGVVTFSSAPDDVVAPTTDHVAARRAIAAQRADGATATGDALAVALNVLRKPTAQARSAIVLLSDGAANAGQDPVSVATRAAKQKISIYTVALGTQSGSLPNPDPFGPPVAVPPDPQLMQQIARTSHGRSFSAQDTSRLISIYKGLGTQLGSKAHQTDITVAFAAAALALLLGAGLGSLRWNGRLP